MPTQLRIDATKPLELNIVPRSPHVVGYRIWTRQSAAAPWVQVADGDTVDNVPDNYAVGPLPPGSALTYWFGIGGNPSSHYRALLLIGQDGAILEGGALIEEGATSSEGFAVVEKELSFV
jgi:hypothetical protein